MAHYALLDKDNVVVNVHVGRDEDDMADGVSDWEIYYAPAGSVVKRTSYNTFGGVHYTQEFDQNGNLIPSEDQSKAFRKNYAGIGFTYDEARDAFIPPKLYDSWILNEDTCLWEAPVAYPSDGGNYAWDEDTTSWIEVTE